MRFSTLDQWLAWQETQHSRKIDLGLERCRPILGYMNLQRPPHAVITVAGTNGKGSSVAYLEAILHSAGYCVGAYYSPHLLRYNERIHINGLEVTDAELCLAFERIDQARIATSTSISYFEFATLAAFDIFQRARLDVAVLEVGLGGRLDAVNALDADVALVTTIAIDHIDWLGQDRESIAREKAGIFRASRPAVIGDPHPPQSLIAQAEAIGASAYCLGRDYGYDAALEAWSWWGPEKRYADLPMPRFLGAFQLQNAAAVLMVLNQIEARLPVSREAICRGLCAADLNGRFQVLPGPITRIFDVAHNPQGAAALAETLRSQPCAGRTLAVFAMLKDKDIRGVLHAMQGMVDVWHVTDLAAIRGASGEYLASHLQDLDVGLGIHRHDNVSEAYTQALREAQAGDRVVVFGSFHTVAEALQQAL